jgi:hypothetical protein
MISIRRAHRQSGLGGAGVSGLAAPFCSNCTPAAAFASLTPFGNRLCRKSRRAHAFLRSGILLPFGLGVVPFTTASCGTRRDFHFQPPLAAAKPQVASRACLAFSAPFICSRVECSPHVRHPLPFLLLVSLISPQPLSRFVPSLLFHFPVTLETGNISFSPSSRSFHSALIQGRSAHRGSALMMLAKSILFPASGIAPWKMKQ